MSFDFFAIATMLLLTLGGMVWMVRHRNKRDVRDTAALEQARAEGRGMPATLHPVIDPDKCMSSFSCTAICPEGDVLGVVDGKAELISPSSCIGHGKCALECPVDAISLVFGTSERGVDLPQVDEFFESSRKGVYIIGELGGMGLIKNAITQGLQCSDGIGKVVKTKGGIPDVLVVGAGPSGLACALGLKKAGLTFRIIDQEATLGGTIAQYPRQKVVMTERLELPYYGRIGKTLISKEELMESWNGACEKAGLIVETGFRVTGIKGEDGKFSVETTQGAVEARKVVLAIGRRGTPRKLGCKGDDSTKVAYRLIDAQQYEGCRVVVVGGGDAALEAAIQLAEETEAEVVLSYRQAELGKARDANKKRFQELVAEGRITSFLPSQPKEVTKDHVVLQLGDPKAGPVQTMKLPNDYVIACIGGDAPTDFLKGVGISMKKYAGTAPAALAGRGSAKGKDPLRGQKRLAFYLFIVGALITAVLTTIGWDYYLLEKAARLDHPLHALLKPAGNWGHGVGIVATMFMLSNFIFSVRKRFEFMKGAGPIRRWLTFHQFVGLMSPIAIGFHAAFLSNNLLASITTVAVSIVVLTGIVGRFIYGLVPSENGRMQELSEITARWEKLKVQLQRFMEENTDPVGLQLLLDNAAGPLHDMALPVLLYKMPLDIAHAKREVKRVRASFPSAHHYEDFSTAYQRLRTLRYQASFFKKLKRLMGAWRIFHVALALMLVVLIGLHIFISLRLGYFWIFRVQK